MPFYGSYHFRHIHAVFHSPGAGGRFFVSALSVTIAGKSYREFDEISSEEFVAIIRQGHMPTSSQPAGGDVAALYEKYPELPVIYKIPVNQFLGKKADWAQMNNVPYFYENIEQITVDELKRHI